MHLFRDSLMARLFPLHSTIVSTFTVAIQPAFIYVGPFFEVSKDFERMNLSIPLLHTEFAVARARCH